MQNLTGLILAFLFMLLVPTTLLIWYTIKNRVPQGEPLLMFLVLGYRNYIFCFDKSYMRYI